MKVSIKGFITCKSAEQYIDCADNYALNKSKHSFSISDGVSKSFFPKVWSEILVTQFVEKPDLKESEFINVCQVEWQKEIDKIVSLPETKWFTKSQYNRKDPALATFVGLRFLVKEKRWIASSLGDSFLFFAPKSYKDYKKDLIELSSKVEPIVFDNFPDYLTSIGNSHKGSVKEKVGNLRNGTFYLMTDALAEWFIKEDENAIRKIADWKSQADFERFITDAIDEKSLTNDDCAILCIELSKMNENGIKYKHIHVTDLKDLINKQEAENEKAKQEKLKEEKLKPEDQPSNSEIPKDEKIILEYNKNEEFENQEIEEKANNDNKKTETEKTEPKEQSLFESKTKNIFDKF